VTPAVDLPRSALLCAWGGAALRGDVSIARAVRVVHGDDEPHTVELADDPLVRASEDLTELLAAVRAGGATGLRLVLPVPGDLTGLAGPPAVNAEAVEVGECLLTVGGPPLALVPLVEQFGSVHEPGHLVTWWVHAANPPAPPTAGLSDVDRQLRDVLVTATRRLGELGLVDSSLSRSGPELLDRLTDVRHGRGPSAVMPDGLSPRSLRTLDLAWRLSSIVELAVEDDGGAVSGWEATRRSQALQEIAGVARHAVVAALNAPLEGAPAHPVEDVPSSSRW
jgi:hypothetical protein